MAGKSPSTDRIESTSNPSHHKFTLGDLLTSLQGSKQAFVANARTADKVEREQNSIAAHWWHFAANAMRFQPNPVDMPGIYRIQLLCDELDDGNGLTAANVAKLRAKICRAKLCTMEEANALSLGNVADALECGPDHAHNKAKTSAKRLSKMDAGCRLKVISALTKHHQYSQGGCLEFEPIGNNALAKAAGVSPATVTRFFKKWFFGHCKYAVLCRRNTGKLVDTLKSMNAEFIPTREPNYGAVPPLEREFD